MERRLQSDLRNTKVQYLENLKGRAFQTLMMAANGKRFVESHYSWDQIKAKYIRLIDRFLSN